MKNLAKNVTKLFNLKAFETTSLYPFLFTLLFVFLTFQYPFHSLESIFYDFRVKYDFGVLNEKNLVIVTMDEESDEFLGEQYPYTYASHHRLFIKLLQNRPKIINYFVNPLGPESSLDQKNFIKFLCFKMTKLR